MKTRVQNRQHELAAIDTQDAIVTNQPTEDCDDVVHGIDEIAAIDPTAYMTLEEMIQRITPETLHDYVDLGRPVGKKCCEDQAAAR